MSMEMKIGQISSGELVFDNVVLSGSADELIDYMAKFGIFKETRRMGDIPDDIFKKADIKCSAAEIDSYAEKINLNSLLVDIKLLKPEDRTALVKCLPSYVNKCQRLDSSKIPACIMKAYDSVCAYVINSSAVTKSVEFTIAKYNKELYNRTNPANIICIYKIDGKYVVLLTQYPVRE